MTFRTTLVTWLISVFLKAARRCLELSLWPKARHMVLIKNCDHPRPTSQPIFLYSVLSYYLHSPLSPDFRLSPILTSFSLRNNCPIFHSEKGKPLEDTPSSSAINFVPILSIVIVEKPIRYPIPVGLHKCANPISPVSGPSLQGHLFFLLHLWPLPLDWLLFICMLCVLALPIFSFHPVHSSL